MSLTLSEVEHIAELARLELTDEEKERFRRQLSDILEYAARLQLVNTSQTMPPSAALHGGPPHSVLRPDVPAPSLELNDVLANAPHTENGQFRVPPVLEQEP
jgi:aspartyl-tRNA(Asn)/glutamyl-tRNA(Gln) amidotransferase subunit C